MMLPGIIIARGGSKRIPRKNVKDFCGKPLVEWTIIQAKATQGLDLIVLSTDDDEIAEIGEAHDILILRRPIMADNVTGAVAFNMAVDRLKYMEYEFDSMVTLMPTQPLRLPSDIDNAITLYYTYAHKARAQVISVADISPTMCRPIGKYKCVPFYYRGNEDYYTDTGLLSIHNIEMYRLLTQQTDHPGDKSLWKLRRKINRLLPYVVPYFCKPWQLLDIDNHEEFELCEILFKHYILDKGYYR